MKFLLFYLNDTVLFSKSADEHINYVQFLPLQNESRVTLKLKKSKFFTNRIHFLGHDTTPGHLKVSSHTTDAICSLQAPSNITELCSFLGFYNTFRWFVPNFVRIAAPLHRKLQKHQGHVYTELSNKEFDALRTLQKRLALPSVFALP